jgi:peptide/nickel transport system substrate-binding protein
MDAGQLQSPRSDTRRHFGITARRGMSLALLATVAVICALSAGVARSQTGAATATRGGTLKYAIDGEGNGFQPAFDTCSQACQTISRGIFDPLAAFDAKADVVPYLAKSIKRNSDATVWTITLRAGIKYTDGEALDGAAVAKVLTAYWKSPTVGQVFTSVKAIEQTGPLTVQVTLNAPGVRFPETLTAQGGWMMAPSQLADKNAGLHPIGTGPFMLKNWEPGQLVQLVRNPHYWRKGLPYLNEIDFIPIADPAARTAALQRGQVQMAMTRDNTQMVALSKIKGLQHIRSTFAASTSEIVLNNQVGPTSDIRVRQALAYSTSNQAIRKVVGKDIVQVANGPFPPGSIGYLKSTGYPSYNLAKAKQLVAAYEADKGPLEITLSVTASDAILGQLLQAEWQQAGIKVNLVTKDPTQQLIGLLTGNFQTGPGALPGAPDPGAQGIWWDPANLKPVGMVSLDYARINDPIITKDINILKTSGYPKQRVKAAQEINRRFASQVYALWTYWTVWGLDFKANIHDPDVVQLPNGQTSAGYREGTNWLPQIWMSK